MNDVVVFDTHSLLWYLTRSPSLSAGARAEIERVFRKERIALVPTVVLAEMEPTVVKHRMPVSVEAFVNSLDATGCRIVPFDEEVVQRYLSLRARLDIFDRIIVATALVYNAAVVTKDAKIVKIVASATVPVIW